MIPSLLSRRLPLALAFAAGFAGQAIAADADAGKRLADQWCTSCHVVGGGGHGTDAAPPLPTIAKSIQDPARLRAWLVAPHPPMPNLNLSRAEIDNITAYLESLR
ncbi:MAG TPA: c-type cytochrome [Stellaceae bacterium]|nr:c-type cytochrome [Stellaceae bacterium]